jgi:hypothetical protein
VDGFFIGFFEIGRKSGAIPALRKREVIHQLKKILKALAKPADIFTKEKISQH